jgi:5-methylcytosine-specific restriction enzyme subunit McrC
LIYDNLLVDEKTGKAKFKDFLRDEAAMARLFERFVYNFFRREQSAFHVKSDRFDWQDINADEDSLRLLPTMKTDVSLSSSDRYIVLDTKYYVKTLQSYYDNETIHSGNLYQIFAYLKNLQCSESSNRKLEGVLLYPTVSKTLDLEYVVHGHRLRIVTLKLDTTWKEIRQRLLELLN